jgi:hypothetical protein
VLLAIGGSLVTDFNEVRGASNGAYDSVGCIFGVYISAFRWPIYYCPAVASEKSARGLKTLKTNKFGIFSGQ